jgi:hypothetical protein
MSETIPTVLSIKGKFDQIEQRKNRQNFTILNEFAGFTGLAGRISDVSLENSDSKTVAFTQFIPGEYVSSDDFSNWSYRINLAPMKQAAAGGHVSWLGQEAGVLFLRDLLPQVTDGSRAMITLDLPQGWISSKGAGRFETSDVDKTIIFVSKAARTQTISAGGKRVNLFVSGGWKFDDSRLAEFTGEIFRSYSAEFGAVTSSQPEIILTLFPQTVDPGSWEGDTRGNTIVIVSSDMPFETQSVQRLHEQLRHEIFHLWFPNAVSLTGNYDWFYEGFALYHSLKTGVALNRLRFEDFLDTLGRAMTLDSMLTDRRSLIDASRSRKSGSDTVVYARGMLAAFLTDIEMFKRSGGRDDVSTVLRQVFNKYRAPAAPVDGNTAALEAIGVPLVTEFVQGRKTIDWANELEPVGIEITDQNGIVRLAVAQKPSTGQKRSLDKLGYNNWRKLSPAKK